MSGNASTQEYGLTFERWLSVDEIAEHLGISKVSIYKWVEAGKIPAHKVGRLLRFKVSEIDAWVRDGGARAGLDK